MVRGVLEEGLMTAGLPAVDALSSATLLDRVRTGLHLQRTLGEILDGASNVVASATVICSQN